MKGDIDYLCHKLVLNAILRPYTSKTSKWFKSHCKVMKLADMPSCLGGGDYGINKI